METWSSDGGTDLSLWLGRERSLHLGTSLIRRAWSQQQKVIEWMESTEGDCSGWDLECPPKALVLKPWSPGWC